MKRAMGNGARSLLGLAAWIALSTGAAHAQPYTLTGSSYGGTVGEMSGGSYSVTFSTGDPAGGEVSGGTYSSFPGVIPVLAFAGTLAGFKFNDLDGDSTWDQPAEPALAGWEILLQPADTNLAPVSALTDSAGRYEFQNVPPGDYSLSESPQSGWTRTFPPGSGHDITLTGGASFLNLNFGDVQPGAVSLQVSYPTRWSLVSAPLLAEDLSRNSVFPGSGSQAFAFDDGYATAETLENGRGYWLKFDSARTQEVNGLWNDLDTIPVRAGWNIVGSIGAPVDVQSIQAIPANLTVSQFFGFSGSYQTASIIEPGRGYWVKADQDGMLRLSSSEDSAPAASAASVTGLRIVPTDELPPPPPAGESPAAIVPREFSLGQNYPNPFNPSTVMAFGLPEAARVRLVVHDVTGRVVAIVAEDRDCEAGMHRAEFDARNLAGGVYFYRITAQGRASTFTEVRKMVLVK